MLNGIASRLGSTAVKSATSVHAAIEGKSPMPFSGIFKSIVDQTNSLDAKAAETVSGLISGQGVEIHDAMIATQKADMAFELALQVRNKAVGAYQQMMNMQF